jgi:hypothetical protein
MTKSSVAIICTKKIKTNLTANVPVTGLRSLEVETAATRPYTTRIRPKTRAIRTK